jgi:hypothetical protein
MIDQVFRDLDVREHISRQETSAAEARADRSHELKDECNIQNVNRLPSPRNPNVDRESDEP